MKNRTLFGVLKTAVIISTVFGIVILFADSQPRFDAAAQANPSPTPETEFDQAKALAAIREQIKGRENEPAEKVFKNIKMLGAVPAGRLLAIMEFGYARSLGVTCTHCHVPGTWESEEKTQKQTARDMAGMVGTINGQLLKNIKNLKSASPTINCTTCHRGQTKPALNLPQG